MTTFVCFKKLVEIYSDRKVVGKFAVPEKLGWPTAFPKQVISISVSSVI
jgi:hypothetical protein